MVNDNDEILNIDGGNSLNPGSEVFGGNSEYPLSPQESGSTGGFFTNYTNVALISRDLRRINATFRRFNDKPKVKFIKEYYSVVRKEETMDKISLSEFFHPLQSFSEYQKQTIVLDPLTSINLDPSSFYSTEGEVSLIVVKAEYLPEAESNEKMIFWDYGNTPRKIMGSIMILSGSIKNGSIWHGWDIDPFSDYNHTTPPDINEGGISFTNPTQKTVKLTILIAN
jgi:hypothetical protein